MNGTGIKALLFDVFGTVVDWRSSVIREATAFGLANGITADWEAFADGWRGKYQPFMEKVRAGGKHSVYRWGGGFSGAQSRRRKSRLSG